MTETDARRAAEGAARDSYGRLLALLACRTRDIAAAEDALSNAFAAALRVWPEQGVPNKPEAWLLTAARRTLWKVGRAAAVRARAEPDVALVAEDLASAVAGDLPDDRLRLLFACAHPAIDPAARAPLMLQVVLGLDAASIARAFVVEPAAMAQRLVRAKAKIRDAGIPFATPEPDALADRLQDVAAAIYAAYGLGWDDTPTGDARGLSAEAVFLARLLVNLLPEEPAPKGLLALMLYCDARARARRAPDGAFVPLAEQDPGLWSRDLIIEAEGLLTAAARAGRFDRFSCEAAIQSAHCQRGVTGGTNWTAILTLYDLLSVRAPTLGILVARAAALCEAGRPVDAQGALDALPKAAAERYQPYWVVRARAHRRCGDHTESTRALDRALALTHDPALRAHLLRSSW
jgi:RNA polymerase sigma-70 factor (ECF subfamily)